MEARPELKIGLSNVDKLLEVFCITILVIVWLVTIIFFSKLPDIIPSHFNASGQADRFSSKNHIFFIPIIATVTYLGLTLLNKYPHIFNYPTIVTLENAKRLYTSASRLIRLVKLSVVIVFSTIVFMTIHTALKNGNGLGTWFLPAIIVLMTMPVAFYVIKSLKKN